jgi:hypothetical protein
MTSFLRNGRWQSNHAHRWGLDLDTAIRLRWALRDIKAKQKRLSLDKISKA